MDLLAFPAVFRSQSYKHLSRLTNLYFYSNRTNIIENEPLPLSLFTFYYRPICAQETDKALNDVVLSQMSSILSSELYLDLIYLKKVRE